MREASVFRGLHCRPEAGADHDFARISLLSGRAL